MSQRKKIDAFNQKERATIHQLETFAKQHNLELANFSGSLYDRVRTITSTGGKCPCFSDRQCPCSQVIQECRSNGECFCRVFLAKDWRERYRAKGII